MAVSLLNLYNKLKTIDGQQINLVAGEKGMHNSVRWVHIVEINELTSFLEGNELIFTVGITVKENSKLLELAKKLYESMASGWVINIGPFIKEIPKELIDFCNKNNFPLFEVPWEVYLGKTMKICSEEINKSEQSNMEIAAAVHNAIYNSENHGLYVPILEKHGFNQEWPYCIALAEYVCNNDEDISELIEKKSKNIENSLAFYSVHVKVIAMGNQIALLFVNQTDSNVYEIIEHIKSRFFVSDNDNVNVYIGVGRNTNSVRCLYKTYKIAHKVVELQKKQMKPNEVMSYRSMGFSKIFLAMEDTEIMKEYYSDVLEPLVKFDELNGTDFTEFLSIYFECGSSIKETSERLFVHRNTVNYKISRIEEILGCDLSDFNTKTELLIALRLKEIL